MDKLGLLRAIVVEIIAADIKAAYHLSGDDEPMYPEADDLSFTYSDKEEDYRGDKELWRAKRRRRAE